MQYSITKRETDQQLSNSRRLISRAAFRIAVDLLIWIGSAVAGVINENQEVEKVIFGIGVAASLGLGIWITRLIEYVQEKKKTESNSNNLTDVIGSR